MSGFKLFGREPTLWLALLNAVVLGVATVGLRWLDNEQAGLIVAAVNALFAAVNAYAVRPLSPAVFTYAASAVVAVLASYGLEITPEQLVSLNSVLIVTLGLIAREQLTPQNTAVSKTTEAAGKPEVQTVPEGQK